MQLRYLAKNIELSDSIKELVETKIDRLLTHHALTPIKPVEVELGKETGHHSGQVHRAEIMIPLKGKTLRVEQMAETVMAAFDLCMGKLKILVEKYKQKS